MGLDGQPPGDWPCEELDGCMHQRLGVVPGHVAAQGAHRCLENVPWLGVEGRGREGAAALVCAAAQLHMPAPEGVSSLYSASSRRGTPPLLRDARRRGHDCVRLRCGCMARVWARSFMCPRAQPLGRLKGQPSNYML